MKQSTGHYKDSWIIQVKEPAFGIERSQMELVLVHNGIGRDWYQYSIQDQYHN